VDLNRLRSYLNTWMRRHCGVSLTALHIWHSDVTGRNPHVHVFMHCPRRLRKELEHALVPLYPAGVIDVSDGGDIRKPHPSGFWGSTLDYLCRFKSQQATSVEGEITMSRTRKKQLSDNTEKKLRNLVPFKPGQSGNPKGRPKGVRDIVTGSRRLQPPLPSKAGNFAMLLAMQRASSSVSTFAMCAFSPRSRDTLLTATNTMSARQRRKGGD